jgi:EmrB/QacA subfamily drug resistance transporter
MVRESNRELRILVAVVVTAVFMANLDLWIVNVALVDIGRDLHGSLSAVSWVLNAYAVTLAALLIPAGRIGDRIGHRQVFLAGTALFTLASIACAAAPNVGLLVVARIVQAAGAAAQLPTSLAILMGAVDPARRLAAARGWSAVGALAAVAGPVLGGLLVTLSWRWVFLVNLPVGVLALWAGFRVLPRHERLTREPMPDLVATGLLIVAVSSVTGALVQAPNWGWLDVRTLGLVVIAAAATAWFAQRCRMGANPMIELALVRVRRFTVAIGAVFLFSIAFAIMLLSNSLWCQDVWHYSALRTGLAMVPGPAMVPVVTFASARLVHRAGAGPVAAVGSVLFAGSLLWRIALAGSSPDYARDLLPSMILGGIGVGLALGTLMAAGATALPAHRSATGSAIVNSVRQIASAFGVAVLVTVLASTGSVDRFKLGWAVGVGVALLAGVASLRLPHTTAQAAPAPKPAVTVR